MLLPIMAVVFVLYGVLVHFLVKAANARIGDDRHIACWEKTVLIGVPIARAFLALLCLFFAAGTDAALAPHNPAAYLGLAQFYPEGSLMSGFSLLMAILLDTFLACAVVLGAFHRLTHRRAETARLS